MNESVYMRKVDLILQAAKNVLDDPLIDFDTPEGAKEALVNEIARIKKQEEADDAEMEMPDLPDRIDDFLPPTTPVERFMDDLFDFSDMHGDLREDFDRFMTLFDEACQKYGYKKRKDGSYHLKGEPVLLVGKYINDHWFDIPKDDDEDPKPGNLSIKFEAKDDSDHKGNS